VAAYTLPSGARLWDAAFAGEIPVANDQLVVGRSQVLDAATGTELWRADGNIVDRPALVGSRVFAPTETGVAVYEDCGSDICAPLWTTQFTAAAPTGLAVAGNLLYAVTREASTSTLRVFDANGCGAATCDPIAVQDGITGLAFASSSPDGAVIVSTSTGVYAYRLPD
jgi:outer membrane protein assembly factor BamB